MKVVRFLSVSFRSCLIARMNGVSLFLLLLSALLPSVECCTCVAFTPNGRQVACCAHGPRVLIMDAQSMRVTAELLGHRDMLFHVTFSPDARYLASGSYDGTLRVWAVSTAKPVLSSPRLSPVKVVAFSPDGQWLAAIGSSGDNDLFLWRFAVEPGIFFEEGNLGRPLQTLGTGYMLGFNSLAWTPDSRHLVIGKGSGAVEVWDPFAWRLVQSVQLHEKQATGVVVSPDGEWVASGASGGPVKLWNLRTSQTGWQLHVGGTDPVIVKFSPDGRLLAVLGSFLPERHLQVWDIQRQHLLQRIEVYCYQFDFSPDGNQVALVSQNFGVWLVPAIEAQARGLPSPTHTSAITDVTVANGSATSGAEIVRFVRSSNHPQNTVVSSLCPGDAPELVGFACTRYMPCVTASGRCGPLYAEDVYLGRGGFCDGSCDCSNVWIKCRGMSSGPSLPASSPSPSPSSSPLQVPGVSGAVQARLFDSGIPRTDPPPQPIQPPQRSRHPPLRRSGFLCCAQPSIF